MDGADIGAAFRDESDLVAALGGGAYGYFAGGAGDEVTLRANASSWLAAGARAVLEQLTEEFDNTLALLGCPRATDLDRSDLKL